MQFIMIFVYEYRWNICQNMYNAKKQQLFMPKTNQNKKTLKVVFFQISHEIVKMEKEKKNNNNMVLKMFFFFMQKKYCFSLSFGVSLHLLWYLHYYCWDTIK